MSDTRLLEQVTSEILADYLAARPPGAEDEAWSPALWATVLDAGLPLVGIPEARGGAGGGWPERAAVLRATGRFGAPVPLAETCLAGWLLAAADLPIPSGPLTVAPTRAGDSLRFSRERQGWRLSGVATRVPWASQASGIAVLTACLDGYAVGMVPTAACNIEPGTNLAGEPRDRVTFDNVELTRDDVVFDQLDWHELHKIGALVRSIQMAGALDRLLELTLGYVQARVQFGRPLGRFQAIQHDLARLAGECVASAAAVNGAVTAISGGAPGNAGAEVAAAKVRVAEAATIGTRIAHQLHGAIGFTQEHQLHRSTTRLWSWRDEFGGEREWAILLGQLAAAGGADGYWGWLTGTEAALSTGTGRGAAT